MKNSTMNLMIAAVAWTVAAGSASAQTFKAEIPMSFRAGGRQMAAGSYDFQVVTGVSGRKSIVVRVADGGARAMLSPSPGSDAPKAWLREGNPKIAFNCSGRSCTLARLWNGQDVSVYEFPTGQLSPAKAERLAVVTVVLTKVR